MIQDDKLNKILNWYSKANEEETKLLAKQENSQMIYQIEKLIGEPLPKEVINLFEKYDGETGSGYGSFFGHSIVSLNEMKNSLDFAKTQIKPQEPKVTDPISSNELTDKIIELVIVQLPVKKRLGFLKTKWFKVEFESSPNSMSGPYFYPTEKTSDKEREIIKLDIETRKQISKFTKELHKNESKDYNWDNLEITAFENGKHTINRTFYDFDNTLPLTSTPEKAIKKKYFHIKWIPIIYDYGGNYIGIDLDPDINGTKGQVIIFGRDEEEMIVLANSWTEFLDWNLELIEKETDKLKSESHLHDIYRQIINSA